MLRRTTLLAPLLAAALAAPVLPVRATPDVPVLEPAVTAVALAVGTTTAAVRDARLVGVTWQRGDADVRLRWRTAAGWTAWDAPETEAAPGSTPSTEPAWRPTGASQVQVEVSGRPEGLALVTVSDGSPRRTGGSGTSGTSGSRAAQAEDGRSPAGLMGQVRSRAEWGADESIRRGRPDYAASVRAVVVHHTVQRNDYTADEVPAILRADYAYHVRSRGWDDLGYNLVVDRFGTVWEGRRGGLGRATIGSHASGFNTGTLGVAVLGDYTRTTATHEVVRALAKVSAYAAGTWGWDPGGSATLTSRGSPRYRSGSRVALPRVFGHLQTSATACPGSLQDLLPEVRRGARLLLGPAPHVTAVEVTGAPVHAPLPLTVRAELSREAPWTAEVVDRTGTVVARVAGESPTAVLEWNGLMPVPLVAGDGGPGLVPAPPGDYTWVVTVDDGFHEPSVRRESVRVGLPLVPV